MIQASLSRFCMKKHTIFSLCRCLVNCLMMDSPCEDSCRPLSWLLARSVLFTVIVQSINTLLFIYPLNVSELICLFKIRTCRCCFNAILLFRLITNFKRPPPWFQQVKVEIAAVTRVISWWSTFSILLPTSNLPSHKSWKTNSWFYLVCIALKHRKIRNKSLFS